MNDLRCECDGQQSQRRSSDLLPVTPNRLQVSFNQAQNALDPDPGGVTLAADRHRQRKG